MIARDPIQGKRFADLVGCNYKQRSPVSKGNLSYCQTQFCGSFLADLKIPYLITHNSDKVVTDHSLQFAPCTLEKWFSCNCASSDKRAVALPLGLLNSQEALDALRGTTIPQSRELLYLNAPINGKCSRKRTERKKVYQIFASKEYCATRSKHGIRELSFAEYYQETASHHFTLSPTGAGPDCHRIWEALYLGTFPVCKKHPALLPFSNLPILFVDDWREVTEAVLLEALPRLQAKLKQTAHKLTFKHWKERIQRCAR